MRSVALMGRMGSGKDTAARLLAEMYGHVRVAFADPLRRMALAVDPIIEEDAWGNRTRLSELVREYGWDTAKRREPEVRRFLQRLGSEGVRDVIGPATWIQLADRRIGEVWADDKPVVLTDVRFPNEVGFAQRLGFLRVWIDRPGIADGAHASESAVGPNDADVVVTNAGTVDGLSVSLDLALRNNPA